MLLLQELLSDIKFDSSTILPNILLPCTLAIIFGCLIGFQREKAERPAGLRTHVLVCLGSTVFTIVSYTGFSSLVNGVVDPSRIAAGIVTGIGFIGAGAIFRQGPLVRGITTAASIWVVASVGMALGVKMYYLALTVTILGFMTLTILKFFEDRLINMPKYSVEITASRDFAGLEEITEILGEKSIDIKNKKFEFDSNKNKNVFTVTITSRDTGFSTKIIDKLSKLKEIEKVKVY